VPEEFLWFYSVSAQISFVLLGFWWAVVTLKRDEWLPDPRRMRIAYYVTLHFIVTGVGSLVSLLAVENSVIWRVGFGAGGALGALAAVLIRRDVRSRSAAHTYGWWALAGLYALVTAVAIGGTPLINDLGFEVKAIQIEGVLIALLLFLGAQLAWLLFVESWRNDSAAS
jgi:hypothetical protein